MDKEKAAKFLNLDDRLMVEGIEATHAMGAAISCVAAANPSGIARDVLTFDGSNARTRHEHRGKLLGVIDRLLGTTAYYADSYKTAIEQRNDLRTAYEKAAAELNAANAKLDQYQSFGTLSPWFGGPFAALTIKPTEANRVFGAHKGTPWSFRALSERVVALEKENDQLGGLASKPMQILDDAQGYYTVNVPSLGSATPVKLLVANFRTQAETIGAYQEENKTLKETIQRKDEKILERAKEIKALKAQNAGILAAGLIPLQARVQLPDGGVLTLDDLINRYLTQMKIIRASHNHLRQTQEDLGDMTVAHNKACETIEMLNARLDKIEELSNEISHVADGSTEPEFEEASEPGFTVIGIETNPNDFQAVLKYFGLK